LELHVKVCSRRLFHDGVEIALVHLSELVSDRGNEFLILLRLLVR
jgi:hypothetical protein